MTTTIRESSMRKLAGAADAGADGDLAHLRQENEHLKERIRV